MQNLREKLLIQTALVLISCSAVFACHGTLLVTGISDEDRQVILQEHNKLRQMVATGRYPGQPGAENMREIVWDDELAARAQKWAENCQFRHDPHRTINRFTMGQNLAIIWSTAPLAADDGDFPSRIQSWFNEVQKYSFGDAWSPKTGHYSQLVWGETSLVGCGYAEYKDNYKYNKLYVCNYGPGGNVVGYNPYEVGKPSCSSYGMKPSSRYHGLCAAPNTNSLQTNAIETYDYQSSTNNVYTTNTNNNNNNNNNNQYNNNNNNRNNIFNQQTQQQQNQQPAIQALSSTFSKFAQQAYAAATQTSSNGGGGHSFGSIQRGGSQSYTTEKTQYKYKSKLEAYRPSPAEFQRSVLKHTILTTYVNGQQQAQYQQQQQQQQQLQQQQQSQPEVQVHQVQYQTQPQQQQATQYQLQAAVPVVAQATDDVTTAKPVKRGWSILTWRG